MFPLSNPEETSSVETVVRVQVAGRVHLIFLLTGLAILLGAARAGLAADAASNRVGREKARLPEAYGSVPLSFEPNRGQTSAAVQWVARGPEYALFLSGHDAVLELNSITPAKGITDRPKIDSAAVRMNLLGAKTAERTSGEEQQAGTANYFTGNDPSKWQREVPNFAKVRLSGVYPGIDLVYYGRQGRLEYDFVVAPGADPSKIALKFDGAEARLAGNGDLILPVAGTQREIRFDKPTVYQMKDGQRLPVEGTFHLASDRTVSFALGSYDRRRELVIDPTLLFAGSIATGNQQTIPTGMVIDATGAMYLTGYTNDLTFPVTTGALQTNCQTYSAAAAANGYVRCGPSSNTSGFVTKISADGTSLVYSTYLHGGGGQESGGAIAVDALGDAYVLGDTSSNDFPITSNAYQSICSPVYSSGAYFAPVLPIVPQCDNFADGGGTEYTTNGPSLFISKLNPTGTALLYSTFFGGTAAVYPEGIALDAAGNIYFASELNGAGSPTNVYPYNQNIPFPTTNSGYQTLGINVQTPALSKLSADGQTLMYSTFLGSQTLGVGHDSYDQAFVVGQNGVAFLGGFTQTADFPTTLGSLKASCGLASSNASYCNTNQGFIAAIDTTKSGAASLVYASYLGGEQAQTSNIPEQEVYGLAADASNNLFVTGYTSANDFPSTAGVYQPHCNVPNPTGNCSQTAFLSKINPTGSALTWSTLLGDTRDGGPSSYGAAIAFDATGQVYLYGLSQDGSGSFPQVDPISTYTSGNKVFLATFSADATQLKFSTRFSGPSNNGISLAPIANGLAVDAAGSMYIVGYSNDNGAFGTTTGTYATPATAGFNRPFFAKISRVTAQSATALTITPASAGQAITFAASVTGDGSSTAIPSGTVTLTNTNGAGVATVLGTITLDGTGNGTFTSMLPSGTYTVEASYSGDSNFEPSQSTPQPLTVTSQLTTNLLQNPGAELGSIADWTPGGPGGPPQVDSGTLDSGINPHTGSYDFTGYSGASDSLSQTVSVLQQGVTTTQVDGGTLLASISFWQQGLNQGPSSDNGSVTLTFLDGTNATISTVTSAVVDSHGGTWTNLTATYAIPMGTRSITYTMNFTRAVGYYLDSFIDDNSLSMVTTGGLMIAPGTLHFGNVPVGSTSAAQTVTLTNQQETTTINIQQIVSELGANPSDFIQTNNCPAALAAGASCTLTVTFVPDGVGPKSAGIAINTDSVPSQQFFNVDGTGTGGILQVNPGNLKTIAGNGTSGYTGDGGQAIMAELTQPNGVAFDPSGNLYIADSPANVVRKVDTTGKITTFAGNGTGGFAGDGGAATAAELRFPDSVASDTAGNIYIQDTLNYVVRKVDVKTGLITTYAGTPQTPGHAGDGGPATAARFNQNQGARFDSAGNLFVPQCLGASIRKIDTSGNISTVAGNFAEGFSGDGGQATAAMLQCPSGVTIDAAGNFYIADEFNSVIRKVNTAGVISTIAGTPGVAGSSGDGGPATSATFNEPNDVVIDAAGNLYVADAGNNRVRKIDTSGIITTVAGGLNNAGSAAVNTPLAVTVDAAGNVYFSDSGNGKIQEIFPEGTQPFPATPVGSTAAAQTLTLSNIGNVAVTIPGGSFTKGVNAADFLLTGGTCLAGTTLAANGGSCTLTISFTPTAVGQRMLTVAIASNALNTPQSFSIGGVGTVVVMTPVLTWATPAPITTATPLSATQLDAVATNASGPAIPGTYVYTPAAGTMLAAGTQTLSVTFTPTDTTDFTTATKTVSIVVTQAAEGGAATTTTLAVTAGEGSITEVVAGRVVTLTATVSANQNSITPGQVAFCDATAATCTDNHLLATAQLIGGDTSSTATYRFVPGIGTHSYKAVFLGTSGGTNPVAGSASGAAPLTVTGLYPTATTIAQSGAPGSYMLSATTVGIGNPSLAPMGTVSFLDSSNANAVLGSGTLGTGTPGLSFAVATSASNFDAPQNRSATADFNGDGILDLATANTTAGDTSIYANTVTISLGNGDGTFTTLETRPATGNRPQSIVAGDFNGDGKADLAVTNTGDGTVTILLGNGDGTFTAAATAAAATSAYGLVTGDFNGDGTLDIAVSELNGITVLLGNGDGTFVARQMGLVDGAEAFGPIATADFNGDGKADLIVENYSPDSGILVLLGNGDGSFYFAPGISLPGAGSNQNNLVAGDFNGDGKVDFAATNSSQNTVLIMLGNGDGTFVTTAAASGTDYYPVDIQTADFDGDGKLDLALAYGSFRQRILLGNGDGTFTTPSIATGVYAFIGVAVGDFNGDGVPDLAGTDGTSNIEIALTQRTSTAAVAATPIAALSPGTHQVVASFPGDPSYSPSVSAATALTGATVVQAAPVLTWAMPAPITTATPLSGTQLDAVATDANGVVIPGTYVYTPAAGTLLAAGTQTLNVVFTPTDTVDLTTATGTTTIVVTQAVAATTTTLAVTSGGVAVTTVPAGSVVTLTAAMVTGTAPISPGQVAFCDATAATCTDSHLFGTAELTSAGSATFRFVPGIGTHSYKAVFFGTTTAAGSASAAATLVVTGKYATTTALAASGVQGSYALTATVDGFGFGSPSGNVVFTDSSTGGTLGTVAVSGGVQSFLAGTPISVGSSPNQVVPADVNGDGKPDIVLGNQSGTMVTVLIGNGDGTYNALPSFGANYDGISGLAVADFNGDGKLDIATANGSTVGIFLGNGDGTFGAEQDFSNTAGSKGVFAADFNGDGKLDLAVTDNNFGITILIGNGDGTFTQPNAVLATGNGPNFQLAVADFNKDGKLDIAYGNYFDNTLGVLLGNGDGTFQAQTTFAVGSGPRASFIGDFNGDGNPDVVVTSGNGASVSVLLGNGDGTFQAQQTYAVGANPSRASVGDLNGDGKLDIAVANQNDGTISILYGNGDGTFQTQQVLTSGAGTDDVAIADVNGDGSPDLEAENLGSNTVTVFLNQATAAVSLTGVTLPGTGADNVVATYSGDTSFASSTSNTVTLTSKAVAMTTLVVTPAASTVGQSVTFTVALNGTTPVPTGTVTLMNTAATPATTLGTITLGATGAGTFGTAMLTAGTYSVTAVYSGDVNYAASASAADTLVVSLVTQTITFGVLGNQTYGAAPVALAATSSSGLPVSYAVTGPATVSGSTLTITGVGAVTVTASQAGNATYAAAAPVSQTFTVAQATAVVAWTPAVATIPYGTALGASQLDATATAAAVAIPGTFVYTPAAGTVLSAGTQTLRVTFTPTSTIYAAAIGTATITVTKATPVITWAAPAGIAYGTPLSATQLDATVAGVGPGALAGTLVYTPAAGTDLSPGTQTLSVVFTPADAVDYTTATASVPIIVGGLALTSFTPMAVPLGSADTKITLTGTGFVPTSVVMVNGTVVATAYVNAVTLTAVIPAALLTKTATLAVSVLDPTLGATSAAQTFTVLPVVPGAALSGPAITDPGSQPTVTLSITNPYPLPLTAEYSLTFASVGTTPVDDPSIQFSTGGRTYSYTVAANSTSVPPVALQAGTDAGTITITAKLMADGVDVTPPGLAPLVIVVPPVVPVISGSTITTSGNTLTVVIHGFSNTREVSQALFDFTAATGDTLATPSVTIPATTIFGTWYGDPTSDAYGSTFTYTQIFNTSSDASTVGSVKVTLTNSVGASLPSTSP